MKLNCETLRKTNPVLRKKDKEKCFFVMKIKLKLRNNQQSLQCSSDKRKQLLLNNDANRTEYQINLYFNLTNYELSFLEIYGMLEARKILRRINI